MSVAIVWNEPPLDGFTWKTACATPEPPVSAEFELTATAVPPTFAEAAGAVIAPVGFVVSSAIEKLAVAVFPAPSVPVRLWLAGVDP